MNELRERLLRRHCPQSLRDAVWAHLVLLSRAEGSTWTVAATGMALPALAAIAGKLTARWAGDPADIDAAVLTGFLAELATIDLRKPRIMLRLRWAAYRAGYAAVREALDAPPPSSGAFRSSQPPPPWGHPDFVLARAVAEDVITAEEAELIGETRLEGVPLAVVADQRGSNYEAVKKARLRAEHRLIAYLQDAGDGDVASRAADSVAIAEGAARTSERDSSSPAVTGRRVGKVRRRVSPTESETGVRGCGRAPAASATTSSPDQSADVPRSSGPTPGVPRCA
ncbi:hypothetical protein ACFQ1S_03700 [Kibdelosporangium lantanae]|uniref:Sigma-70 family RNA polymerase sigma factor n=1 Tax=Kibdelosporangium lantanae TaxID=1497396 RepID=A0ABW3M251_9PSEU